MPAFDDAFLRLLVSLSGQAISFSPGCGGFDDALNSLVFQELCERNSIACAPFAGTDSKDARLVVVGSIAAGRRAKLNGRNTVVLPGSLSRFEEFGEGFDDATTVFWRDRVSLRMAELRGAARERAVLCQDLAIHLDVASLPVGIGAGEGSLTININGQGALAEGDHIRLQLDGSGDRWTSSDACREAVRNVALLMANRAEITTDSLGLAILAAKMGKTVRLQRGTNRCTAAAFQDTIAPVYPSVTLDPEAEVPQDDHDSSPDIARETVPASQPAIGAPTVEAERLKTLLRAARRQAQFLAQERDQLFVLAADLRTKGDSETVAVVRSYRAAKEQAEDAERRATERFAEAEARRHEAAGQLAAFEGERDAAISAAEAREAAARESAARETAARKAAEGEATAREAALHRRLADADAAFDARTRQTLMLQDALDERDARALATEGINARMRALIDTQTARHDAVSLEAEALRHRLDAVLSSASWRVTRPLRGITRVVRRLTGAEARGGHG